MHSVIIAGGGPTGMMLAGELALAGVDVAIVERRADRELLGSRAGGLHARTIEVLDQRGIAERFLAEGQITQTAGFAGVKLDISDFPTRHPYGLALWQKHIERILAGWVDELPVTVYRGREVTGFTQDDAGVDVELAGGDVAAGGVPRRVRRRPQRGPQGRRHRVPRLGSHDEQPDRRGRDGRAAGARHPPRRRRHPRHRPGGVRDPRRRGHLRGLGARPGHGDRGRARRHGRAHPARAQRGAHRRLRDRLRDPQPHLHLPVHRYDPAGRRLSRGPGAAGRRRRARARPGRRTGPQHRRAGRGEPRLEAGPGGQRDVAGQPAGHVPRRAPPGRRPRPAHHDGVGRAAPRGRAHQGAAGDVAELLEIERARARASPR